MPLQHTHRDCSPPSVACLGTLRASSQKPEPSEAKRVFHFHLNFAQGKQTRVHTFVSADERPGHHHSTQSSSLPSGSKRREQELHSQCLSTLRRSNLTSLCSFVTHFLVVDGLISYDRKWPKISGTLVRPCYCGIVRQPHTM